MPTLSFSCPKCNKLHERIKPEMVGHKVRCQCGFVFRLGSKSDKQEWFSAELKRKRAFKKQQEADAKAAQQKPPTRPVGLFDLQPKPDALDPFGPNAASLSNDVHDAIPIVSENRLDTDRKSVTEVPSGNVRDARPNPAEPELFSLDDLSDIPTGTPVGPDLFAAVASTPQFSAAPPIQLAPVPIPRRRKKRKRGQPLKSPAGPVCSLVLTLIGIPATILLMILFAAGAIAAYRLSTFGQVGLAGGFGQPGGTVELSNSLVGSVTLQLFLSIGMFLLYGALALALVTTAVVAVIELTNRVYIGWASKVSAIVASVVLACLLLLFFTAVFSVFQTVNELEKVAGVTIDTSTMGKGMFWLAFRYCMYGLIPLAVMITGFARVMKR